MKFSKYHALGNDYVVIDHQEFAAVTTPRAAEQICAEHFGIGADGILVRQPDNQPGHFAVRMINSDGSEAEKSGNGLRIFARYLYSTRRTSKKQFTVETVGGSDR